MTSDSGAEIEYHGTNGQARLAVHRSVAARMRLFGAKQITVKRRRILTPDRRAKLTPLI